MRIFWWQAGLHLDPENDHDREALLKLEATLRDLMAANVEFGWPEAAKMGEVQSGGIGSFSADTP